MISLCTIVRGILGNSRALASNGAKVGGARIEGVRIIENSWGARRRGEARGRRGRRLPLLRCKGDHCMQTRLKGPERPSFGSNFELAQERIVGSYAFLMR